MRMSSTKAVGEGEEESSDEECDDAMDEDAGENKGASKRPEVWRPSGAEDEDVELEYDETAYDALPRVFARVAVSVLRHREG